MMRFLVSCIFSVFFVTTAAFADPSSDLAALLNNVRTMKATFTQTIYDNRGKAIQKAYGRMAIQRPGKFRWEVTKPIPQLVIANQTKLWIYDPDLEQVTIRSISKVAGETPALLLSQVNTVINQDYKVKIIASQTHSSPALQWFELTPKNKDNMFLAIQMGFQNHQIQEMRLEDNLGHSTIIRYQHIQTNIPLSDALFTFKPSRNIDVIDETRHKG